LQTSCGRPGARGKPDGLPSRAPAAPVSAGAEPPTAARPRRRR
jgi:hypothetical protein